MNRRSRLALDLVLFVTLLVAFFPAATGISVHEWLSLAMFIPVVVHTAVNWDWVVRTVSRVLTKMRAASWANLTVDTLLFVSTVTVMLSGLMVSQVIARTVGLSITPSYVWHTVHSLSAKSMIILTLVHLALHWRWVIRTLDDVLPAGTPREMAPVRVHAVTENTHDSWSRKEAM